MPYSVLSFAAGIIIIQQFSVLPETTEVTALFCLCIICICLRYWRLMFFVMGLLWAIIIANVGLTDRLPEYLSGQQFQIKGKIVGLPIAYTNKVSFDFAPTKSEANLPTKIRLS